MPATALRGLLLGTLAWIMASCSQAADNAGRSAPSRPGATAARTPSGTAMRKFGSVEYLSIADVAARLDLQLTTRENGRKVVLSAPRVRAELEIDTRDITINGLRVFLGDPTMASGGQLYVSRADFEHCLLPSLRPGLGIISPAAPRVIAIDPGHGGRDDGTENRKFGLKEKALTLDVALRLKRLLEADGYRVLLTRTTDRELSPKKEVDLPLRADLANRAHADLFLSIHFNSAPKDTQGTEVYTYAPSRQHATAWWSGLQKDDDLEDAQPVNRFDHWSVVFAQTLHRQLLRTLKTEDRGKKIAHWAVLKMLDCPGVLVEPAILSNDAEARRVATPEFRQQIAEALAAGIRDYAAVLDVLRNKSPVKSATHRRSRASRPS